MAWLYDLQLISGYDKKTIMNNINKLLFEIENRDILYIFLFKHYCFLAIFFPLKKYRVKY